MADYPLGAFLARWYPTTTHDLAASESETWRISQLLAMAQPGEQAQWDNLTLGYPDPRGSQFLRERIAAETESLTEDDILCFAGAQEALGLVLRALVTRQDHAIMVVPAYQPSELALTELCDTTGIALDHRTGWSLDIDAVEAAIRPNTRLVLVNFPNNPTGKLISRAALLDLVSVCRKHRLWLVNDEVYRLIDRDPARRLPCVADLYEHGVSVNALSKAMGLPGLRVGWIACRDRDLIHRATSLKQIASLCLAGPSEVLAHIALGAREVLLLRNREIAARNLAELERFIADHEDLLDWHRPDGGVVGYVRYRGRGGVEAFATRVAEEIAVLVLPSSVWRSALAPLPQDRFRIGFGRLGCSAGLKALRGAMRTEQGRSAA